MTEWVGTKTYVRDEVILTYAVLCLNSSVAVLHRQNLADAAQSDSTLEALVTDNQEKFAAVGLGMLPDSATKQLVRDMMDAPYGIGLMCGT